MSKTTFHSDHSFPSEAIGSEINVNFGMLRAGKYAITKFYGGRQMILTPTFIKVRGRL